VSSVRYYMGFYILGDDILHSHRRENLRSYTYCFISKIVFFDIIIPPTIFDNNESYCSVQKRCTTHSQNALHVIHTNV
jgi:hypothetical protein